MARLPKTLFLLAAAWSVIAGLLIFFLPAGTSITVTAQSNGSTQQILSHPSWYETQGWWGIAILVIFAALYYAPLHFYQRHKPGIAALFGMAAIMLTLLAGFSIGLYYFPAALVTLIGIPLMGFKQSR